MASEERSALVDRICASDHFRRAKKLQAFLRHICEKTEQGCAEQIKEYEVGTEVFGRKPGYNVGEDNIVRVQARLLRARLERYFEEEGNDEPVVLRVPRGAYIPEFVARETTAPRPSGPRPDSFRAPRPRRALPLFAVAALTLVAVLFGASAASLLRPEPDPLAQALSTQPPRMSAETKLLYSRLLGWPPDRLTLVVLSNPKVLLYRRLDGPPLGADLNLIPLPSKMRADLETSLNHESREAPLDYLQRQPHSYTGMGEAASAYRVGILMERLGIPTELTQGRFLDWDKARSDNLVVLGPPHINEWTRTNLGGGAFEIVPGSVAERGGGAIYPTSVDGDGNIVEDFGFISLLDLGESKALILAGRSAAGTYGVGEFFFDPAKMSKVLAALTTDGDDVPSAWQALVRLDIHGDLPVRATLVKAVAAPERLPQNAGVIQQH